MVYDNEKDKKVTPEQLDKMFSVIEIKSWIALATVLAVLGATLIWGFFGTMQLRENVTAVLVKRGKIINIFASGDGILLDFSLKPEQYIEIDQVVARIEQISLVNEINLMLAQNTPSLQIESKRQDLLALSQIRAYDSGRVVDTYVHAGDYVRKGDILATISKEPLQGSMIECLLFIPHAQVNNIRSLMSVNIFPASINRDTFGNMIGSVTFITERPVTYQYLYDTLGSAELATEFLKGGALYEVYVTLVTSEETVTGYKWTASLGPNKQFANLTLCEASVLVETIRPIDVFFFGQR